MVVRPTAPTMRPVILSQPGVWPPLRLGRAPGMQGPAKREAAPKEQVGRPVLAWRAVMTRMVGVMTVMSGT
jgi:hypothetical protein